MPHFVKQEICVSSATIVQHESRDVENLDGREKMRRKKTTNKLDRFDLKDSSGIDKDVPFWATLLPLLFLVESILSMFDENY